LDIVIIICGRGFFPYLEFLMFLIDDVFFPTVVS